mmetsp:Transcript_31529/g.52051  ORF Transcript_31529/g.52051 Transcript_31529/m.52051 type:complete len:304 (+) Transcript_31529:141-1052(+)|eukprot:CAMPEP_0119010304 /NCGR_PEP_ID=MMETSP1176-20130426/4922_1 /TAXON_ID=265551 /ORGANISM="Synedropsis recta cf, Strain CCMP1620" /LENGTH=303 /DNA_ID=CAMNT_0006962941 /DNA_START=136 /DNA_END=1047 /DNA_ORIENTATION=+
MSNQTRNARSTKSVDTSSSAYSKPGYTDSEVSSTKETTSEDSGSYGGWFGDIKSLAKSTKDSIFPAIDGIANILHRSAMTVAAEIAQLERDAEMEADRWRDENYGAAPSQEQPRRELRLPWEVRRREAITDLSSSSTSHCVEDESFKQRILELSKTEDTFMEPYGAGEADDFPLNEQRIHLIRRLLDIDENLAATHAKLSGRSDVKEALFWKNYFYHCDRLRMEYDDLVDIDVASRSTLGSLVPTGDGDSYYPSDNSYVCVRHGIASPPSSLNTLTSTLSVGDVVVIGADGGDFNDLDNGKLS